MTRCLDCVISDDESSSSSAATFSNKSRSPFSSLFHFVFSGIFKPLQPLTQFLGPKRSVGPASSLSSLSIDDDDLPTQVLKNFNEICLLRIELPSGELGMDQGVLLKWRADFGSTLDNCMILSASSMIHPGPSKILLSKETYRDDFRMNNGERRV
ncbi:unnamed protein product [Ilex paraguariensis]|uniref:F-box protein n=1 Tax=Ilex paraguariensis TaxID=185542 RepID=A0ABC8RQL6_9AQUA